MADKAWPPARMKATYAQVAEARVWWQGRPESLTAFYTQGGTRGTGARGFWARVKGTYGTGPTHTPPSSTGVHVPVARTDATVSGDLLCARPVEGIHPESSTDETRARLAAILDENGWESLLPEAAEVCSGLGGVYLKIEWDQAVTDKPIIRVVHPDRAIPEYRRGRLTAVTFWTVLPSTSDQDRFTWRHLERHWVDRSIPGAPVGRVTHTLLRAANDTDYGQPVPLTEHPATAGLAEVLDDEGGLITGHDGLSAFYVPNMLPNPALESDPIGCEQGRADLEGLETHQDALDEVASATTREVKHGKSQVYLSQSSMMLIGDLLPGNSTGTGGYSFDEEVVVPIAPLTGGKSMADSAPHHVQPDIRHEALLAIQAAIVAAIARDAGYSEGALALHDGDGVAATATEVTARGRRTRQTVAKKTRYWVEALTGLLPALLNIDRHLNPTQPGAPVDPIRVTLADPTPPTEAEVAAEVETLDRAGAISTREKVKRLHPDWADEDIDREAGLIRDERGLGPLTDPDTGFVG